MKGAEAALQLSPEAEAARDAKIKAWRDEMERQNKG